MAERNLGLFNFRYRDIVRVMMNVLLPTEAEPNQEVLKSLRLMMPLKFVSFGEPENGVTSVFPHEQQHYGSIENIRSKVERLLFQGAGGIEPLSVMRGEPLRIIWGSVTCERMYGYDKPDKETAHAIEECIRQKIESIIKEVLTSKMR